MHAQSVSGFDNPLGMRRGRNLYRGKQAFLGWLLYTFVPVLERAPRYSVLFAIRSLGQAALAPLGDMIGLFFSTVAFHLWIPLQIMKAPR